jgi:restriction system protein
MGRRKKSSAAEDFIDLVALLPWWAGVLLAVLSYLGLHGVASQPITANAQSMASSGFILGIWARGLATVGQYVVPIICLAGAGVSAFRRKQRSALVTNVAQGDATSVLDGMSWREFEMLVGEGFRLKGYQVVETGGGGADGGVDLVLTRLGKGGGEKFLVQCKQWRAYKVGVDVVRELYGVMAARGATGGFVVTSGRFTEAAISFASGRNVTLVDGPKLLDLIRQAKAGAGQPAAHTDATAVATPSSASVNATACPVCSKPMVRRTAKRGANAGGEFWGCTGYPACRGARPIN